jgi:hypothetical protein
MVLVLYILYNAMQHPTDVVCAMFIVYNNTNISNQTCLTLRTHHRQQLTVCIFPPPFLLNKLTAPTVLHGGTHSLYTTVVKCPKPRSTNYNVYGYGVKGEYHGIL